MVEKLFCDNRTTLTDTIMIREDDFNAKVKRVSEFLERNGMLPKKEQFYRRCEGKERSDKCVCISLSNFYAEGNFHFNEFVSTCSLFVLESK